MTNCPNCGAPLEDGDAFCGACGASVGEDRGTEPDGQRADEYGAQPRDPTRRSDQQHQGRQNDQPHQGGEGARGHRGRSEGGRGRSGGQGALGGGTQPGGRGHPRQGPEQVRQGRGQPRQGHGQRHQGHGQPRRGPGGHQAGASGRRDVLKYGAVAVAVLGGGWLLYDTVLGGDLTAEEQAAREVVRENARALENEDLDAMKATLHPESPKYSPTIEQARTLFQQYDLTYDLEIESVEVDGEEARVEVVQTTRKVSGPAFRDNRTWFTHVLRKYNAEWRIYDTIVEDFEYLD